MEVGGTGGLSARVYLGVDDCAFFRGSDAVTAGDVTWKRLCGPHFVRLVRDVYLPRGVPVTHELRCRAATMIIPEQAVITGRSAATVRSVPLARPWDPVEIVVPERSRFGPVLGLAVRRTPLPVVDSRPWADAALATSDRLGLDLALRAPLPDAVADLDAALAAGVVDQNSLLRYVVGRREHGITRARKALRMADERAESRPESRLRVLLALAGVELTPQLVVRTADGRFVARLDLGCERRRTGVEYDGAWHADRRQLSHDRERLNRLQAAGWHIVFVTAEHLHHPNQVVATVRAALNRQ